MAVRLFAALRDRWYAFGERSPATRAAPRTVLAGLAVWGVLANGGDGRDLLSAGRLVLFASTLYLFHCVVTWRSWWRYVQDGRRRAMRRFGRSARPADRGRFEAELRNAGFSPARVREIVRDWPDVQLSARDADVLASVVARVTTFPER